MSTERSHSRGVGSLIGATFILLILLTGYSLFLMNTKEQTTYQNILSEMHQRDLEQMQEAIDFKRITADENGKLHISLRNEGSGTAHVLYMGVFDKQASPEIQTYYDVDLLIDPVETVTYESPIITLVEGGEYEIQLVTEAGNIYSKIFRPGYEVFSDVEISIIANRMWLRDNYPSGFYVNKGNYLSGDVPGSVQQVDGDYLSVGSTPTSGATSSYYPTAFSLLCDTSHLSGSLSDLTADDGNRMKFESAETNITSQYSPSDALPLEPTRVISGDPSAIKVDDGVYMSFSSYISATSTTSPSKAFISYRSNDGSGASYPKIRDFNGSWSSESELSDAGGNIMHVRMAYCTKMDRYNERIVVTLGDDRLLDAYVFNGSSWSHSSFGRMSGEAYRPFDVAYEGTSGRALVVYGNDISDNTKDLSYRIWNGTAWSDELYIDDTGSSDSTIEYRWINLETNPTAGSNEIGMVAIDNNNNDANAAIWNGSNWVNWQEITGSVSITDQECVAITYEYSTGYLMAVAGQGNLIAWSRYTSSWSTPSTFDVNTGSSNNMGWLTLKSHKVSGSNRLMLLSLDDAEDACAADWTGSDWGTAELLDTRLDTRDCRCLDGEWEPTGTTFLVVAGDRNRDWLSYKIWTPSGGWTPPSADSWNTFIGLTTDQQWIQIRADPRGVGNTRLLIATLDDRRDLVITTWDGTVMTDQIEVTTNVGIDNTEAFEIAFQLFGDPIEYTGNMEVTGSSNLYDWNELTWTVDSSYSTGSASITLQLYNYSEGAYPSSGDGYISYTSSSTPNTDETRIQVITSNPNYFKDTNGNWSLKLTAVKASDVQFDLNLDFVKFKTTTFNQACIVEFTGSSNTNAWQYLVWMVDSRWSRANIDVTLQLYDYDLDAYSVSGDGYISYVSSTTPNTDELKLVNITSTPWKFRDTNGEWKLKITGLKRSPSSYDLDVDLVSFTPTSGADVASTEYTFTGISTESPGDLCLKMVSDHTTSYVGVDVCFWNYVTSSYASSGQGYLYYTSTVANESIWLNITSGASSYINGGESKVRITSTYPSLVVQNVNLLKLDYSNILTAVPFNTTVSYLIKVLDETTGEPRPCISITLFSNGTTVEFEGLGNPAYVFTDEEGTYELELRSSTVGGETFKLYVLVGSVAAEKNIAQLP